jgi:hypothetical protein
MYNTHAIQSLLVRDLEARSSGSSGRALTELLEDYCLDLLGEARPLAFALHLQSDDPACRRVLEELLEWTSVHREFQLVVLVALAPRLERVASRLGRGRPSDDALAEVLAQATVALAWTHELVEGERADFVLAYAASRTRRAQRQMARHNVPTEALPGGFDRAEPESGYLDEGQTRLARAIERRVITVDESRLIEETRGGTRTLHQVALATTDSYDALRLRRSRAEARLRRYFNVTGEGA